MERTLVLIIGTDGSGKSTLCRQLLADLPEPKHYVYFGLRDALTPWLRERHSRYGDKGLLTRMIMFPLDYALRRRRLPKRGYVLLDRVPGWAFTSRNSFLRWIYRHALPASDVVILCHGNAEAIVSRKTERSLEACKADLEKWRSVFERYPARHKLLIDTTKLDEETSARRAVRFILKQAGKQ